MYHVEITVKKSDPPHRRIEREINLSFEKLDRRFLAPYRKARPVVIRGRPIEMGNLHRIRVYETEQAIENSPNIPWKTVRDVTTEYITGHPGWELEAATHSFEEQRPATDTREVFVVHGRNLEARDALFDFLRSIDLHPLEWSEAVQGTGKALPYIREILDAAFSRAHAVAVIVLFTPDDEARLRSAFHTENEPIHETQLTGQARPNVLLEAGMALTGSQDRTVLVELGSLRPFSDVAGLHVIRMDNSSQRRQDLAQRLQAAGCPVNLDGTDWHTAGNFMDVLNQFSSPSPAAAEQQSNSNETPQISDEGKELLAEATKDRYGMILMVRTMAGTVVSTNGKDFGETGNRRSEARWEQAIRELLDSGLIQDPKGKGEVFEVTHQGFEIVDALGNAQQLD